jgi:mRNA-degrading endonuclease HigB of HigAB toxin-antitoxin module
MALSTREGRNLLALVPFWDYRLVVAIAYKAQIVFIKFVGTHKEYDRIEAQTVEYLG